MARFEDHADLAVRFKASDTWTMASAGVDHNERPPCRIDFNSGRWNNADERVIHGPIELPTVDKKLGLIVEHMRCRLGEMLAVLVAALADDVPKQDAALRGIDQILDRRANILNGNAVDLLGCDEEDACDSERTRVPL